MPTKPKTKNEQKTGMAAVPATRATATPEVVPPTLTNYEEIQKMEIEALQAIYMDDFEELTMRPAAWNRAPNRGFSLRLKASTNEEIQVVLTVELPSTYPKTLPSLNVSGEENFKQTYKGRINEIVEEYPKNHLGQEMIFDVATQITDVLEEVSQNRIINAGPASLQVERQQQEALLKQSTQQAEQLLRQEEQDKMHRREDDLQIILDDRMRAQEERERHLEGLDGINLDSEIAAWRARSPDNVRVAAYTGTDEACEEFDLVMTAQDRKGRNFKFRKVSRPHCLVDELYKVVWRVTPITKNVKNPGTLILIQTMSRDVQLASSVSRRIELEGLLDQIKQCSHTNIAKFYDYKIELSNRPDSDIRLVLTTLMQDARHGSLAQYLAAAGGKAPTRYVREFFAQLLDGMEYYEKNAIIHPGLSLESILVTKDGGSLTLKIAHGYDQSLAASPPGDDTSSLVPLPYWTPPEVLQDPPNRTLKTPIFELGIVFLQMTVGDNLKDRFTSFPDTMRDVYLSATFHNVIIEMTVSNQHDRIRAFKVTTYGLLQYPGPLVELDKADFDPSVLTPQFIQERLSAIHRQTANTIGSGPRYSNEWSEASLLGKGGFGKVVKARNKLDNQFYAVKKITSSSKDELTKMLPELVLLSRINSVNVVRYYSAWIETEVETEATSSEQDSSTMTDTLPSVRHDFMSSKDAAHIVFGVDSDDEDDDDEGVAVAAGDDAVEAETSSFDRGKAPVGDIGRLPRLPQFVLYIQMEYCEKSTLREAIAKGLWDDVTEYWRLFRHVLDGLVYIHGAGIIHRDLKPENIFIDRMNVARIGDFGLATVGQIATITGQDRKNLTSMDSNLLGTKFYMAPELEEYDFHYTTKADMYALGIILFEMCFPLKTGHERSQRLTDIRHREPKLPPTFRGSEYQIQRETILKLVSFEPKSRPSATELSDMKDMPWSREEDPLTKLLAEPDSAHVQNFRDSLFKRETPAIKDHLWDRLSTVELNTQYLLAADSARETLAAIFKRHGAIFVDSEEIIPASAHYEDPAKLLESSGLVLQLPYDLTMCNARLLARHDHGASKTYTFGSVYRQTTKGGRPLKLDEADFDIISRKTGDFAVKEAEVIKVMDEISYAFPQLRSQAWSIHINHADLLDVIFSYCQIPKEKWTTVKQHLASLNLQQNTWSRIKSDLRSPQIGLSSTTLDELGRFNITGPLSKTRQIIEGILTNTPFSTQLSPIFRRIQAVFTYAQKFKVQRPLLHRPLSCYSEHLYEGSILFQMVIETKKRMILWAVGGRYDRLIEEFLAKKSPQQPRAVGFHLNTEEMYHALVKAEEAKATNKGFITKQKRCDVLVTSNDADIMETTAIELLQELWDNEISADLANQEDLNDKDAEACSWIVVVRRDKSAVGERGIKVKAVEKKEEVEVAASDLVGHLRNEIRLRNGSGNEAPLPTLVRRGSRSEPPTTTSEREVQVLVPQHRNKKANRRQIIDAASLCAREVASAAAVEAPIAALDTSDDMLEALRDTRLKDGESWKAFLSSASLGEKEYLQQLQDMLKGWAAAGHRAAFVFNYKTKACILYDLGR